MRWIEWSKHRSDLFFWRIKSEITGTLQHIILGNVNVSKRQLLPLDNGKTCQNSLFPNMFMFFSPVFSFLPFEHLWKLQNPLQAALQRAHRAALTEDRARSSAPGASSRSVSSRRNVWPWRRSWRISGSRRRCWAARRGGWVGGEWSGKKVKGQFWLKYLVYNSSCKVSCSVYYLYLFWMHDRISCMYYVVQQFQLGSCFQRIPLFLAHAFITMSCFFSSKVWLFTFLFCLRRFKNTTSLA